MSFIDKLKRLHESATEGPFEYRIGDDLNIKKQIPCVIGSGLSCVAKFAGDHKGHADAELFALLRNYVVEIIDLVETAKRERDSRPDARIDFCQALAAMEGKK